MQWGCCNSWETEACKSAPPRNDSRRGWFWPARARESGCERDPYKTLPKYGGPVYLTERTLRQQLWGAQVLKKSGSYALVFRIFFLIRLLQRSL